MSAKYWPRDDPALLEINAVSWLWELSQKTGQNVGLGDIPEDQWDFFKSRGMDYIWLMGVWKRSPGSRQICLNSPQLRASFGQALPGFKDVDILGSPYAVQSYEPDSMLGNWDDLKKVRHQLHQRGMGLILDFIPNHTALDHPWVSQHPEYYILGSPQDFQNQPDSFFQVDAHGQSYYIAHGRDPNFPAWTDTAQVNYRNPAARAALIKQVSHISDYCDGLRCDMAMLVINAVFDRDWSHIHGPPVPSTEFWRELIQSTPNLVYMAEAYWDTEWELQQMGFDFVYDKRLYDRLRSNPVGDIIPHLQAGVEFQNKLVRFIENHDESRSLEVFGPAKVKAAVTLCSMLPGLKLYFQGQFEGLRNRMPVQLRHSQIEPVDQEMESFYQHLLEAVKGEVAHSGIWKLKTIYPHSDSNFSKLIAYTRQIDDQIKLVVVNLGAQPTQGRIMFQEDIEESRSYKFVDTLTLETFVRKGVWMAHPGLIFDLTGFQARLFDILKVAK